MDFVFIRTDNKKIPKTDLIQIQSAAEFYERELKIEVFDIPVIIQLDYTHYEVSDIPSSALEWLDDDQDIDIGYCQKYPDGSFEVMVAMKAIGKNVEPERTLAHEFVHLKQYIKRELIHLCDTYGVFKKQKHIYTDFENYDEFPWEKEAYEKEEILYNKFMSRLP